MRSARSRTSWPNHRLYPELVPKKGLEPPHPCEYVDLNHARLPIPPLRHETQIQQFPPDRQQL